MFNRSTAPQSHNSSFESAFNTNSSAKSLQNTLINNLKPALNHHHHHPHSSSNTASTNSLSANALKRKRKNRTAFTANQIFELEKRFANQRYLSPHDRDRIAAELNLSTAQVITWFQNRRAKQKRDLEEMKNDVNAAKSLKILDTDVDSEEMAKMDSFSKQSHLSSYQNGFLKQFASFNYSNSEEDDDNLNRNNDSDETGEIDVLDTNSDDSSSLNESCTTMNSIENKK